MECGMRKKMMVEAVAAVKKTESDELQARLGCEIALAELNRISGTYER
jgi:hypothetical protein